jgi:hypothetical protein
MRFSVAVCIWLLRTALLCLLTLQFASARERGPRVEVRCPSAPIPVKLAERRIQVYELHISNFDSVPLTLPQSQVFARRRQH